MHWLVRMEWRPAVWSVDVSASVNLPLHHKVQKFSSGTGSPGWFPKRAVKRLWLWCGGLFQSAPVNNFNCRLNNALETGKLWHVDGHGFLTASINRLMCHQTESYTDRTCVIAVM